MAEHLLSFERNIFSFIVIYKIEKTRIYLRLFIVRHVFLSIIIKNNTNKMHTVFPLTSSIVFNIFYINTANTSYWFTFLLAHELFWSILTKTVIDIFTTLCKFNKFVLHKMWFDDIVWARRMNNKDRWIDREWKGEWFGVHEELVG